MYHMQYFPLRFGVAVCGVTLLIAITFALGACGGAAGTSAERSQRSPLIAKDINGTPIVIPPKAPKRIVSLTPTSSEVLAALHLDSRVIGVDAFTDYPPTMASNTKVTDQNGVPNVEQIVSLRPDLVLSYGGLKPSDAKLLQAHLTEYDLPITDLATAVREVRLVGQITGSDDSANSLADSMQRRIDAVRARVVGATRPRVYMEVGYTPQPAYAFGGGSFGDDLIKYAGGVNVFADDTANGGFPAVSDESIIKADPQVIILTEDPRYGGDPALIGKRPGWYVVSAVKEGRVYRIDPDVIERPGPRIVDGLDELAKDLHPELFQ